MAMVEEAMADADALLLEEDGIGITSPMVAGSVNGRLRIFDWLIVL